MLLLKSDLGFVEFFYKKNNKKIINVALRLFRILFILSSFCQCYEICMYHKISLFLPFVPFLQTISPVQRVEKSCVKLQKCRKLAQKKLLAVNLFCYKMHLLKWRDAHWDILEILVWKFKHGNQLVLWCQKVIIN